MRVEVGALTWASADAYSVVRGTTTTGIGPAKKRSGGASQVATGSGSSAQTPLAATATPRSRLPRNVAEARADLTLPCDHASARRGSSDAPSEPSRCPVAPGRQD